MSGWIKLDRSISDNWLWREKPFSRAQAWVDLLLCANHTPAKLSIKGQPVEIIRGQQARSEVTLAKCWGWSRGKVRRFLDRLETEQMIVQQTSNLTSILTICNYERFQTGSTAGGTADGTPNGTAPGQQAVHSKECKEGKEEKSKGKTSRFIPPSQDDVREYCNGSYSVDPESFVNFYDSKGWMVGKNKMKDWKAAVRQWHSRNKSEQPQSSMTYGQGMI